MNKVIRAEFGRTINAGLIIAIAGIIFSICFDSFNDLIAGLRNGQGYVGYFFLQCCFWWNVYQVYAAGIYSIAIFCKLVSGTK